jgi:N,N'-diacetyllegionaminate synthase
MSRVTVISEIGINHGGSLERAKEQIRASKEAGADIAKFQYYDPVTVLGADSPYLQDAQATYFTKAQHEELKAYCDGVGIEYLVSVFDIADIPWADSLCKRHKVASRMNQDKEFITALLHTGKEVIISTRNVHVTNLFNVRYMYCITNYPTKLEEFAYLPSGPNMGLSSHCPSIAPALAATVQGATILEQNTTLDRRLPGCDQSSSITYEELTQLVSLVREIEKFR